MPDETIIDGEVVAIIQAPLAGDGTSHGLARITASSQGA
jgi:hypothetical protein